MMVVAVVVVIKQKIRNLTFFLQLTDYNSYKQKTSCKDIMKTMKNVSVSFFRLILYYMAKQLDMHQHIW
jgi:hypothetical protein